jgi:hypothetical protein
MKAKANPPRSPFFKGGRQAPAFDPLFFEGRRQARLALDPLLFEGRRQARLALDPPFEKGGQGGFAFDLFLPGQQATR